MSGLAREFRVSDSGRPVLPNLVRKAGAAGFVTISGLQVAFEAVPRPGVSNSLGLRLLRGLLGRLTAFA